MKSECSRITSVFYKSYGTDLTPWKREKKGKKTCLILSLLMHGTAEGNVPVCSYRSEQSSGQTQHPSDCQREELCDSCTELNCLGAGCHFSPPLRWSRRTLTSRQEQFWHSALTRLLIKYSTDSFILKEQSTGYFYFNIAVKMKTLKILFAVDSEWPFWCCPIYLKSYLKWVLLRSLLPLMYFPPPHFSRRRNLIQEK